MAGPDSGYDCGTDCCDDVVDGTDSDDRGGAEDGMGWEAIDEVGRSIFYSSLGEHFLFPPLTWFRIIRKRCVKLVFTFFQLLRWTPEASRMCYDASP